MELRGSFSLWILLRSAVGKTHVLRSCDELYHFTFSIDRVGIPFGFQTIKFTLARYLVSRCLWFPATGITWTFQFLPTGSNRTVHLSSEAQCVSHLLPPGGLPQIHKSFRMYISNSSSSAVKNHLVDDLRDHQDWIWIQHFVVRSKS